MQDFGRAGQGVVGRGEKERDGESTKKARTRDLDAVYGTVSGHREEGRMLRIQRACRNGEGEVWSTGSREGRVRGGGEIEYMVKRGARERGDGGARGGEGTDGGDGEEVVVGGRKRRRRRASEGNRRGNLCGHQTRAPPEPTATDSRPTLSIT